MFASRRLRQCSPQERAAIADFLGAAVLGGPDTVATGLNQLAQATGADELMLVCDVFDTPRRLRSLDIAAQAVGLCGVVPLALAA